MSTLPRAVFQALVIKTAVEEPETDIERAILLIERGRDSKAPATRAQYLSQALQKLATLPAVQVPKPTGTPSSEASRHGSTSIACMHALPPLSPSRRTVLSIVSLYASFCNAVLFKQNILLFCSQTSTHFSSSIM